MQNPNSFLRALFFLTLLTSVLAGVSAPVFVSASPKSAPLFGCPASVITQWTFAGDVATPSTGSGVFASGSGLNPPAPPYTYFAGTADSAISFSGWESAYDATDYLEFAVDTTGKTDIVISFDYRSTGTGPNTVDLYYFIDATPAMYFFSSTPLTRDSTFHTLSFDLSSIPALNNNPNAKFRLHAFGSSASAGALRVDNVTISNICVPPRVLNVTSTSPDGTYTTGSPIAITVTFSDNVNVTGAPQLMLETGATDRPATYSAGSGTKILTFNYTVQANDVSADLDYVATNSLSLNGGTITGAVGNANLTLPSPGATGSLGSNNAIVIDNQVAPRLLSFTRLTPSVSLTNADTLIFRATFSEPVTNVDVPDFVVHTNTLPLPTTTATVTGVSPSPLSISSTYDVTISGGDLAGITFNGVVGLDLSGTAIINDSVGSALIVPAAQPATDETYTLDNIDPTVTVEQAAGQADPTFGTPINFTVVFSEPIYVGTGPGAFESTDITQTGTATGITWRITNADAGVNKIFTLSAIAVTALGTTTLRPSINTGRVADIAGNFNSASSSTDNTVTFDNSAPPSVTINQAVGQADPTNTLPIKFTVVFSEAIQFFTPADITQPTGTGRATGITWSITDSGDQTTFTLSATAVTGAGNLRPSIEKNRVLDLAGNNNEASTSTDNRVTYDKTGPTVTVNQAAGQADPTNALPINFTVLFSEPINVSTFTSADISLSGAAGVSAWFITNPSGDKKTFTLSATAMTRSGTVIPFIAAGKAADVAGNTNNSSTSTDNSVSYTGIFQTPTRTPIATATATPTLGIIISEVAWMGTVASSTDEWVELYNGGATTVDLSGWTLKSTDGVINIGFLAADSDHDIAPGEYFIVAPVSAFTDVVINKNISVSFDNNGKSLQLRNNAGILIDTANSDGGTWPAGIGSPTFATMERHAGTTLDSASNWYTFAGTPVKHDRNNNLVKGTPGYANWAVSVTATPTRTRTATPRPPTAIGATFVPLAGRIIINEILPRPGFDWNQDGKVDVLDEFIEIKNIGNASISLSGWKLDDEAGLGTNPFTLPAVTLKVGERMVFYSLESNVHLSDGGDTVRLLNPNNLVFDAYTYSLAKFEDQTICRLPDGNGSWYEDCVPTPNLTNTREGEIPSMPGGDVFESPVCSLPDTLPSDFLFAECRGYGANIWHAYYWDKFGWQGIQYLPLKTSRWESFVE